MHLEHLRNLCLAVVLAALFFPSASQAACINPIGSAGDTIYNGDYHLPQYCNGTSWVAMATVDPARVPTTNGLVAWWKLNDGSGGSAIDSSGNGYTGTLAGSPTWTNGGYYNSALNFGAGQYVTMGNISAMNGLAAITVSAWVKSSGSGNNSSETHFVDKSACDGATNGGPFELGLNLVGSGSGLADFAVYPVGGSPSNFVISGYSTTNVDDGKWHFVLGRYDGANVSIWVDGSQQNSTAASFTMSSPATTFDISGYCSGNTYTWNGLIDDVRVYNRALTATEITTLYNYHISPPSTGLIHWWKLDETAGTATAADTAGGLNATLSGTAAFTASGKIGGGLSLPNDATVKFASFTTPSDMLSKSQLTLSMWFKRAVAGGLVQIGQESAGGYDDISIEAFSDGLVYFEVGSPSPTATAAGTVASNDTNWHLATLVFDGTQTGNANRIKGYIDGIPQTLSFTGAAPATTTSNALTYHLGGNPGTEADAGTLDDVRVYSRALSDDEVYGLYRTSSPVCSSPSGYEGDLAYNAGSNHVLQFCDNASWRPLGPVPGAGGGGCSSPSGAEGNTIYNDTGKGSGYLQYCDGTNWIKLGTQSVPTSGLIAYWKMDESSGSSASDSSGSGNTVTLFNSPTWNPSSGHDAGMLQFNGTTQYGSTASSINLSSTSAVTVAMWFKYTYTLSGNGPELFEFSDNFNNYSDSFILWDSESTCTGLAVSKRAIVAAIKGNAGYNTACFNPPTDNVWHHLVAVYDTGQAGANEERLYIDGILQTATSKSFSNDNTNNFGNRTFYLQARGGTTDFAAGKVDEFRIYNRALSAAEIWQLYSGT